MIKKFAFVLGLAGLFSLTGCKKDYTCTCTFTQNSIDTTLTILWEGVKKSEAEDGCAAAETTYKIVDAGATCSLD